MKKERPPCEGGPPQQNIGSTLPLGVNGSGCYSSAVTASTLAIEAPANFQAYTLGTNGHHEPVQPQKEHTDAYYRKQVQLYAGIDPNLTFFDAVALDRMSSWVRKPDGLMISGAEKLGNYFGMSKQAALATLKRLERFEYLNCHKRGRGRGIASQYQEGEMYSRERREWIRQRLLENEEKAKPRNFERTEPKGKPRGKPRPKGEKVQKTIPFEDAEKVQKLANKRCKKLYPQPIEQPIRTHTNIIREAAVPPKNDASSAFIRENWMAYTDDPNLFPGWPEEDREECFGFAKDKPYLKDGNWRRSCAHYYKQWQRQSAVSLAPASIAKRHFVPAPFYSSCESKRSPAVNYGEFAELENEIYLAIKADASLNFIEASAEDRDLFKRAKSEAIGRLIDEGYAYDKKEKKWKPAMAA